MVTGRTAAGQVHECGLSDGTTVNVIWSTWKMPEMLGVQISLSNVTVGIGSKSLFLTVDRLE